MGGRRSWVWTVARRVLWVLLVVAFALAGSGVNPAGARVPVQDVGQTAPEPPFSPRERPSREARLEQLAGLTANSGELATAAKSSDLGKLDSHLQDLLIVQLSGGDAVRMAAASKLSMQEDEAILVDVYVQGPLDEATSQLTALGMQVLATNEAYGGFVEGYLPVASLLAATSSPNVRAVLAAGRPSTDTGSATSQGDAAHNAPAARLMGEDGAGIVVGIISDSMNQIGGKVAGSQAGGDLPASVTVLLDDTDLSWVIDEGRAMGEIIYDTAPGITDMYFSSGTTAGAAGKADSINDLVSNGVNVIADDISFTREPFFQDGVVSQAVDSAYAAGVAYFSSAGNAARQSYEQGYRSMGLVYSGDGDLNDEPHDFDPASPNQDPWQTVTTLDAGECLYGVLQWEMPWGGTAPIWDFDWYLYNASTGALLDYSNTDNNGGMAKFPIEWLYWCNETASPVMVENEIDWWHPEGWTTPTPAGVKLKYVADIENGPIFTVAEYDTSSWTVSTDAAAARGAMAVAAIHYGESGLNDPETYSSRGLVSRLYDSAGVHLVTPEVRQRPQVAGADCVITSSTFESGLPFSGGSFCGTSAAAPSVAGVASLVLGAKPNMPPGRLYNLLQRSTIDCTAAGNPDIDCGYGFVLADKALILARETRTDFNADGQSDPAKFTLSTGETWWLNLSNNVWTGIMLGTDATSYVPRSDFDGDGMTDAAKFVQPAGALWYIESSTGGWGSLYVGPDYNTSASGSDFDGDGRSDPAKYLQGAGSVWYYKSSTGLWQGTFIGSDASPYLPASDYDGDGMTDMAKYVPAAGAIWYLKSSTGLWDGVYIGSDGTPISGSDFDGDGKTDMAKYLTGSNSLWYRKSSTGTWVGVYLGPETFTYVTASDFDGDGMTDPAKVDSTGTNLWYLKSTTGLWEGMYMGGMVPPYVIVN
jgi:hypothetical protein